MRASSPTSSNPRTNPPFLDQTTNKIKEEEEQWINENRRKRALKVSDRSTSNPNNVEEQGQTEEPKKGDEKEAPFLL